MVRYRINKEKLDAIAIDGTKEWEEFRLKMKMEAPRIKAFLAKVTTKATQNPNKA